MTEMPAPVLAPAPGAPLPALLHAASLGPGPSAAWAGPVIAAIAALLVLCLAGWAASARAVRVDRLHRQVLGSRATLETQLVHRAQAAVELAASTDRAILLTNGRVALDAPGPSQAIIAASLEANPEDPKALLGPIPAAAPSPFDEVVAGSSAPATTPVPSFSDPAADETALMAPISTDAAQASDQDRADAAERNIPTVDADDPALAEPEVSDLVVRARKILSDLPGSIAPKE